MLILTCIIILKYWWKKYRWLSAILVVTILLLLIFLVRKIYRFIENRNNILQTEEWLNILDFSNTLEIKKDWKLQSYPEVTLLSDIDGEVLSLNVSIWDIVEDYDILMQIRNANWINSDYDDIWEMIETMYENYDELEQEYKEFQNQYWTKIKQLEKQLYNDQNALIKAIEFRDEEGRKILEEEIEKVSKEYNDLKTQKNNMENKLYNIDSEAKLIINKSDKYFYESEKQTPRSPFKWVIWDIYVNEWEVVKNWDKLITVINNNFTPQISVSLDFDEYLLTKDLTWVNIVIENENWWDFEYEWEIFTRSPILNNEWKYTITIKIIGENISDLILYDENTTIKVIFIIDSTSEWIPTRCFRKIWKDNWVLILRDWDVITDKEIWIKNTRNWWINIDKLELFWLEKDEKIDWIQLCVEDWNNELYKDESVVEWRNQFETLEDFCSEFIKVNPMYWEHRNLAIVSELWWPWEKIEVLCDIE